MAAQGHLISGGPEPAAEGADLRRDLRLLSAATFTSTLDRFTVPPLLLAIAREFGASLGEAAAVASAYFLFYGVTQLAWGILSDSLGRVRLMRLALLGAAVAGILSALAPSLWLLVVARALTGSLFGAVIPTSLVYVGDRVPVEHRQRALADLVGANALATALATVGGGLAAALASWRVAFVVPALLAAGLAIMLARLPEPTPSGSAPPLTQMREVAGQPWAYVVVILVLIEGSFMFGLTAYFAPALESSGYSAVVAGLVVAVFGLGTLAWTRVLRLLTARVAPPLLLALGALLAGSGYVVVSLSRSAGAVLVASVLVSACYAFTHTTLQTWATDVVPKARATMISFFATALFVGSALGTQAAAPLAAQDRYGLLFAIAALIAFPLGLVGAFGRWRYARRAIS